MKNIKTYIVLDESGAMHIKDERYFVIGGFITRELHKVSSSHKRIEKCVKEFKNIPIERKVELKSSKIKPNEQAMFLNELYSINSVIPIAIVVDKYNLKTFGASENVAYNYFVKTLIGYLYKCKISMLDTKTLVLRVDNRNVSVKNLKDLKAFLEWEFRIDIEVKYLNSINARDIQMADYVANLMWKKFNKSNENLSSKIIYFDKLKMSKFPIDIFGKNPTLKDLKMVDIS